MSDKPSTYKRSVKIKFTNFQEHDILRRIAEHNGFKLGQFAHFCMLRVAQELISAEKEKQAAAEMSPPENTNGSDELSDDNSGGSTSGDPQ